ncbi:membrane protein [Penguinpox virus]|uniref:Membrane protein n=1 Tax=Penguinpox virus TaxID=648998 RepID=A0A068ELM7_9POXV|nr:membrane protein [Penguinpox virus]AID46872.1 membrane protein [Penguinpox virus]
MDDVLNDEAIFKYCESNPKDRDCLCLHPEPTIEKIGEDLLLPYYCWYEPCKRKTAKIPTALKDNMKRCNLIDCSVSLGEVNLFDGILKVNNDCLSSRAISVDYSVKPLKQEIHVPIIDPKYLILCLAILALIVLINW